MITNLLLNSLRNTTIFGLLFLLLQFLFDGFSMATLNSVLADTPRHLFLLLFIFIVEILQNIIRQQRKVRYKVIYGKRLAAKYLCYIVKPNIDTLNKR